MGGPEKSPTVANAGDFPGTLSGDVEAFYSDSRQNQAWTLKHSRHLNVLDVSLKGLSIALAAAAGITVLPEGIHRWVGAALAFAAAIVSGATAVFRPDREWRDFRRRSLEWQELAEDARMLRRGLEHLPQEEAERRYGALRLRRKQLAAH